MKNLIVLVFCSLTIFSACKKKTEEPAPVDLRDQYLGTWEGPWSVSVTSLFLFNMDPEDKVVITKTANTTNKITLTNVSDATKSMTATVNANSFTLDQFTRNIRDEGKTAPGTFIGTGKFDGQLLLARGTFKYSKDGTTYDGDWNVNWAKQ